MIDFTNCQIDKTSTYGGSDQKRGIFYHGHRYMLKFSDRINTEKRNELNSSYSNSIFSEYICCHILQMTGFSAQNTLLGTITQTSHKGERKVTPVVACENFIPDGYELVEFKNIEGALLLHNPPRVPELTDIYDILTHDNVYFTKESGEKALSDYWDLFVMDALFGNFDRHANNWGYLVNKSTGDMIEAPIYDCGSCLYPQLADEVLEDILSNPEEVRRRIFDFPNACLAIEGKKVSYYHYLCTEKNEDCLEAVLRIIPRIDFTRINAFIDNMEEISDIRKTFYKTMLENRYTKILLPAYEHAQNYWREKEGLEAEDLERG